MVEKQSSLRTVHIAKNPRVNITSHRGGRQHTKEHLGQMNTTKTTRYHASIDPSTRKVRITEQEGYFLENEDRFVFEGTGGKWVGYEAEWYSHTTLGALEQLAKRLRTGAKLNRRHIASVEEDLETVVVALDEFRRAS